MAKDITIVDGALACAYAHIGEVHVLVLRNALHVPSMYHKLISSFIMRADGVTINYF